MSKPNESALGPEGKTELADPPTNRQIVIYELPTSWSLAGQEGEDPEVRDVDTFQGVVALFKKRRASCKIPQRSNPSGSRH